MNLKHPASTLVVLLITACLIVGSIVATSSWAQRAAVQEPASEGRPITPAGTLVRDMTTQRTAVGALPVGFVRSPDKLGPGGQGRYVIAVNSGYGVQFRATGNRGQQSLAVMDLNLKPAAVIQNVYFPSPQSVNVGVVFSPRSEPDGSQLLYVSGGFENKIWIFRFHAARRLPISPASPGPETRVEAPFIDVSEFADEAKSARYNSDHAPVYPTGLAISPDGNVLFVANNLGDSVGMIAELRGARKLHHLNLRHDEKQLVYPYGVVFLPVARPKLYVSCWNDDKVAVLDPYHAERPLARIAVGRHPTAMLLNPESTRLYVANSNDDSVSVIDTQTDREIERINVRLSETVPEGNSPEGLALSGDDLYVANAHSNSVAVVELSPKSRGQAVSRESDGEWADRSMVRGFIPTGQYPSALAVVGRTLFVGNGKGTGVENSSLVVNNSGRAPNAPNEQFSPAATGTRRQGGQYSVSLVVGNISAINTPDDPALARYTQQVMRNNGLLGPERTRLFAGRSPIKHVIYVIKENRTYDQVFGDVAASGDGMKADGDASLAIFGAGSAAARPDGRKQDISPNHRALALRFGLLDRFFVNSEASPDGHNWSTAAFSTDYVDKAFRWQYSRRGRTYDYEGFNRLPNYQFLKGAPSLFAPDVEAEEVADFLRKYVPYLQGDRDVAEPATLYLWDAAARAGLTYRNYGEFLATLSEADIKEVRENREKAYPDISTTVSAFATKKSLEGRFNAHYRNFDMATPDAMTVDSYRAARENKADPLINGSHADARFRGNSRLGAWLEEFRTFAAERAAGTANRLPNLSVLRLSNDHTDGLRANKPTPQFYVADNDYALGLLVEAVSNSPYWKDTCIAVVEDDAQDGPDHVDAHRSVVLLISAYNRPGALVHEFHNTVSLIRTIELLLGIEPMNQLDATATPIDIFRTGADQRPVEPDLRSYKALLPDVALDNLLTPPARDATAAYWMRRTAEQNMAHADMADPETLNRIIWFSVRGSTPMPPIARLPLFDAMRLGLQEEREEIAEGRKRDRDE
ncbi:MAG TPA: bifunctional YncE family protein/alkaline phosphatase family protein [Pyrinomonadaceae bacterium]|nr:bifunctional YncE family protein/alkaline phosphatase family protein [Pyrinomonadaceae bacterium]